MSVQFVDHPLRYALTEEMHVRTFEPLRAPVRVAHLASLCGERGSGRNEQHLKRLLEHFGLPIPDKLGQHYFTALGKIHLRWERHTEFVSYTIVAEEDVRDPFGRNPLDELPADWLRALPGEVISSVLLALEERGRTERDVDALVELFNGHPVIGSSVAGGAALAYSDMRIHEDGHGHILLRDVSLSEAQAGRLVKRILELKAYRAIALLGLPLARSANRLLSHAEGRLTDAAKALARTSSTRNSSAEITAERALLADLTALATEIESVAAQTNFRFEASNAYYHVIEQRLAQLRQRRIEGLQTFDEFIQARLSPAIATCVATRERQQGLAERSGRLIALLRARVEVGLQEQNRSLLDSMDRRAQIQLRLQETVEGLSVIAISYYGAGLVGYLLKGLNAVGAPIEPNLGLALSVPVIAAVTWFALHHTKRHLRRLAKPSEQEPPSTNEG